MGRSARLGLVALVLVAGGAVALLAGGGRSEDPFAQGSSPGTPLPVTCLELPEAIDAPRWAPEDLPHLEGSYAIEISQPSGRVRTVAFAEHGSLDAFVQHVLDAWPDAGWILGHGEREPGEAEATFSKGERVGAFRARSVYCDPDWTQVLIVLARREAG